MINIKSKIDKCQIVSFDIFDTLLIRPYVKPTDLFRHLEQIQGVVGFSAARIAAEAIARKKHPQYEDITIDEIYEELPERFQWLLDKELEFESQVLQPNPAVQELYQYALAEGKTIIVVSDMYLTTQFLAQVLEKKGYTGFSKLYVSSKYRKMKHSGNLFRIINDDLGTDGKRILHLGDNRHSDFTVPRSLGWNAVVLKKPMDLFFEQDIRVKDFYYSHKNSLNISILLGVLSYRYTKTNENYWNLFGFKYAGPVIYAYMAWLAEKTRERDISTLLFVARDGYTLKKVFDIVSSDHSKITTSYVYASRLLNILINLDVKSRVGFDDIEALSAIRLLINFYRNCDPELGQLAPSRIDDIEEGQKFIQSHIDRFQRLAKAKHDDYADYINQYLVGRNIALVDTCSIHLSSQRLLQSFCDGKTQQLTGFYWFTVSNPEVPQENLSTVTFQKDHDWCFTDWDIMEFLMTSPEPPVQDVKEGKPVYKEQSTQEKIRSQAYPSVSEGAVDFAQTVRLFFGKLPVSFTSAQITEWINCFSLIPSDYDLPYIKTIEHACDSNHEVYVPICKPWFNKKISPAEKPLVEIKLFGLPLLQVSQFSNQKTVYLCNCLPLVRTNKDPYFFRLKLLQIPVFKIKYSENKDNYYLFNKIPVLKVKK